MPASSPDGQLAPVARQQAGCFTLQQAVAAGFTPKAVANRLTRGVWITLHQRVYCAATAKRTPELLAVAALLRAGATAAFSHVTGGRMQGFDLRSASPFTWLSAPLSCPVRSFGQVKVVRTRHPVEPTRVWGHPVLPPARTLVDLAALLDQEELTGLMYDLVRRDVLTVDNVAAEAESIGGGRAGLGRLRRVMERFDPAFEMMVEASVGQALARAGVHMVAQYEIWDGPFLVARVDLADPHLRHAVEIDGFGAHSTRAQQRWDRTRDRLTQKLGWTTSRFDAVDTMRRLDDVVRDVLDVRTRLLHERRTAS